MSGAKSAKSVAVIWGASGHAKVVLDILRLNPSTEVVGFIDSVNVDRKGQMFCGLPVLGGLEILNHLQASGVRQIVVGFGDCRGRLQMLDMLDAYGLRLVSAIHPSAIVSSSAHLGSGVVVCANAVVNSDCRIGRATIINTAASVDHDCTIGDAVHIAPGVRLGGWVEIGTGSFIGIGSTVRDRTSIGSHTTVGAGSLVLKSLPSDVVAYGHPARVIRSPHET